MRNALTNVWSLGLAALCLLASCSKDMESKYSGIDSGNRMSLNGDATIASKLYEAVIYFGAIDVGKCMDFHVTLEGEGLELVGGVLLDGNDRVTQTAPGEPISAVFRVLSLKDGFKIRAPGDSVLTLSGEAYNCFNNNSYAGSLSGKLSPARDTRHNLYLGVFPNWASHYVELKSRVSEFQ